MEQNASLKFVFFPPSPWSERARWALDHSGIAFETLVYTPMLSTPRVRWMTRNFTDKLTVPAAVQEQIILRDSYDIAEHANSRRLPDRQNLFPEAKLDDIRQWNQLSEYLLDRLRVRAFPRMRNSRQLKLNNLPPVLPNRLKPYLLPLSDRALRNFEKKYPVPGNDHKAEITGALQKVRDSLEKSGNDYLTDTFSYADMTVAAVFQCISPVSDHYVPLDPAVRECWTDTELKKEFSDLLAWRDRIYEQHRLQAA